MPEFQRENTRWTEKRWLLPEYNTGNDENPEQMLRRLVDAGMGRRYENLSAAAARLEAEWIVIRERGLASLFLILWDLARTAESNAAPFYCLGPIAGSIVAYALGLTDIDPLRYHLFAERFMGDKSDPTSFEQHCGTSANGKNLLNDYISGCYGQTKNGQNTKGKSDGSSLQWLRLQEEPLVGLLHQHECALRNSGEGAIDWSEVPLEDAKVYARLREMMSGGRCHFPFLEKFDTQLWRSCPPEKFEDLMAAFTLMWPGPDQYQDEYIRRKAGRERPECLVDALEPILRCTAGLCLYQEQFMEIYHVLTRRSLAEGYQLRRILAMRKAGEMEQWKNDFMRHSTSNGIQPDAAQKVWDYLYRAARGTFNKAHTATCCLIPYRLAWLDVHHPEISGTD